jgi:hypothetical protein
MINAARRQRRVRLAIINDRQSSMKIVQLFFFFFKVEEKITNFDLSKIIKKKFCHLPKKSLF